MIPPEVIFGTLFKIFMQASLPTFCQHFASALFVFAKPLSTLQERETEALLQHDLPEHLRLFFFHTVALVAVEVYVPESKLWPFLSSGL